MDHFKVTLILVLSVFVIILWFDNQEDQDKDQKPANPQSIVAVFNTWNLCMRKKSLKENDPIKFWTKFQEWTDDCDKLADIEKLGLMTLKNHDELKYGLLPVEEDTSSTDVLVTLGIGNDIDAEVQYQKKINEIGRNLTFYGADPITDKNAKLYSTIGKYFPFAVGADSGYSTASVYLDGVYVPRDVVHVDLIYFLDRILKIKTYDNMWMDAEGAEYGLFEIFYKSGPLDKNGIKFCQMSLEVHQPNENQKVQFMQFIKTLVEEQRYGTHKNVNVGHMRMYLFNYDDAYCVRKFLPKMLYE